MGQRNAICIYWMEQHPDYMQSYYDDVVYNLDVVTENILDIEPYIELEDLSSVNESDDDSNDESDGD